VLAALEELEDVVDEGPTVTCVVELVGPTASRDPAGNVETTLHR